MDRTGLFAEARALATAFEDEQARLVDEERAAHVANVAAAQSRLLARLTEGLEDRVLAAAAEGKRELEVLVFEGSETFDDEFCYLYLLKGARGQPEEGVVPLLATMRRMLAPFRVRHVWRLGTVQNTVLVSWRDE